jgi:hypothetical protein
MKNTSLFLTLLFLIIPFLQCNQTSEVDLKYQGELSMISYNDQGCVDLAKGINHLIKNDDALHSWKYENYTLTLDFLIHANCACLFVEDITTTGSILEIVLTDTADGHAHCTCDFMESFSFSVQGTNQVQILFSIKLYPDYEETLLVDKVLKF